MSSGTGSDSGSSSSAQGSSSSSQQQQYSSDLRKCESMSGSEKSRCVKAAKKKHGQM